VLSFLNLFWLYFQLLSLGYINVHLELDDFEPFSNISVQVVADNIVIQTIDDNITLEYNDRVNLVFTLSSEEVDLLQMLEAEGEYLRDTASVTIIDNDELQINFEQLGYSINEGDSVAGQIAMQFGGTEDDFTLKLTPVSIADSKSMYDVVAFIDPDTTDEEARASTGTDFTSDPFTVRISAGMTKFVLPDNFLVDDDVNEIEQDFALIGELGTDVPDSFACFQRRMGDERGCIAGRTGATTIQIIDNDPMVIGFTLRSQTVSESQAPSGQSSFIVDIEVMSERASEVDYKFLVRHVDNVGDAAVTREENVMLVTTGFDALFGIGKPLEEMQVLAAGNQQLSVNAVIIDDVHAEEEECFTLRIVVMDTGIGMHRNFTCNEFNNPVDFFCLHTVCIEDDDG
jgi:hypothetical protein